jgi:hypothetical protein
MEKKQTAVQWFMDELEKKGKAVTDHTKLTTTITIPLYDMSKLYRNAIQMEKEQIVDAWNGGDFSYFSSKETGRDFADGEQYYNEVYGGGDEK